MTHAGFLRALGLAGWGALEPAVLAALASESPLLLVGPHGSGKTLLLARLAEALGLAFRHYNASILSFDDLLGYPVPQDGRLVYLQTPAVILRPRFPTGGAEESTGAVAGGSFVAGKLELLRMTSAGSTAWPTPSPTASWPSPSSAIPTPSSASRSPSTAASPSSTAGSPPAASGPPSESRTSTGSCARPTPTPATARPRGAHSCRARTKRGNSPRSAARSGWSTARCAFEVGGPAGDNGLSGKKLVAQGR